MKKIALMLAIIATTSMVALAYGDKDGKSCSTKESGKKSCCSSSKEGAESKATTTKTAKAAPVAKATSTPKK